jgi:NADH-quinone oxidoreductase subunit J
MAILFYTASALAIVATLLAVTRANPVHALLYLVVSLLAVALVFLSLGAPFVAALEVIVYAGAIIVLFVFVVMLLNVRRDASEGESRWLAPGAWLGPSLLALALAALLGYAVATGGAEHAVGARVVGPQEVGLALMGPYLIAVELASLLLLAGLVAAYHVGRRDRASSEEERS